MMLSKRRSSSRGNLFIKQAVDAQNPNRGAMEDNRDAKKGDLLLVELPGGRFGLRNMGSWPRTGMTKGWAVSKISPACSSHGRQPARGCPSGARSRKVRQRQWPVSRSFRVTPACFRARD